ncbi:MAG: hypothetical protein ACRET5_01600, partial [Steroidobacteraceae bacterium]
TLPGQRVLRATLSQIADLGSSAGISSPALLIVGDVVAESAASESAALPATEAAETAADLIQPI